MNSEALMSHSTNAAALRLLDEMHTAASSMGDCGDEHHYMPTIEEWRACWKYFQQNETELRALLSAQEPTAEHWRIIAETAKQLAEMQLAKQEAK